MCVIPGEALVIVAAEEVTVSLVTTLFENVWTWSPRLAFHVYLSWAWAFEQKNRTISDGGLATESY